jgi:WD40 repeat protein/class 3 adenylate cyclase
MAAILAADAVGYSRLIGRDEESTLATLKAHRQIIDRLIAQYGGRIFGSAGDSVIAEFASPVEAVRCATETQLAIDKQNAGLPEAGRLRFRIGINLGDVVVEGDNLMGDGVNVAARLEALAPAGGICVSEAVYAEVRDRLSLEFVDLGQQQLKNIARSVHAYRVPLASEEQTGSPFRGLDVFEFDNADLFFGRARANAACIERLEQLSADGTAFLLIYGMSGSGKSSLLRAGLLPSITRPGTVAGIASWRRCLVRPSEGPDAVASLAAGLLRQDALPELARETTAGEFAQLCRSAPDRAVSLVRHALGNAASAAGSAASQLRLVIAIDQMEELFTTEREPALREALVRLLAAFAASGLAWVIATIRSDFFHRCGEVPGFSALKDGLGSYELLPPNGAEIAQIIREPARAAGLRFEESADRGRLDDVLQQAAAADPGSLPLLEFTLDALYQAGRQRRMLTFAAYRALGGLEGAIARRADEVVDALAPDVQQALPAVLRALTTVRPGEEKAAARPALLSEVAGSAARRALVDALIAARLLVSDEDAGGHVFVRVAHEALLSRWPQASDIVNANRNFLETRARLAADARRWQSDNRNQDLLLPSGKRLAEGEELLLSRRDEVDDLVIGYIEASSQAQQQRIERDRQAERTLIEAAEAAKRERLEREAERRSLAADAASRLARRTRYAAIVASALALMAGVGAFAGFRGQQEATRHAVLAQTAEKEALAARDQALRSQSLSLALLSQQTVASGDNDAAILLALEALPAGAAADGRPYVFEAEAALHRALLANREKRIFNQGASLTRAVFNATGEHIVTPSHDGTARIWDVSNGAETTVLKGHHGVVETAEFSPDGRSVVTAARDGTARLWDAATGKQVFAFDAPGNFPTATFSPAGNLVLTAAARSVPTLWDATTGAKVASAEAIGNSEDGSFTQGNLPAAFSPDGGSFAMGNYSAGEISLNTVSIWSAADGRLRQKHRVRMRPHSVAFSPDGGRILINGGAPVTFDKPSRLWDVAKGTEIAILGGHKSDTQLEGVLFSHDGRVIATASLDGTARLWDGTSGRLLDILGQESAGLDLEDVATDERDRIMNSAFSHDDRYLATTSLDNVIRIWDVGRASLAASIKGHGDLVKHVAFSPVDNNVLLTASNDGTARLWDIDGALTTMLAHDRAPTFAVFSPDNLHLLTGGGESVVHLWDVASGREIAKLDMQESVRTAAFSPDGSRVVTASLGGRITVWDVAGKREIAQIKSAGGLRQIEFSPGGDLLAAGLANGSAQLWDAASGAELAAVKTSAKLPQIIFSRAGDILLAATSDKAARLLKPDGTELMVLAGHESLISAADFSPGGELVATASLDRTARIWSVKDGSSIATLKGHSDELTAVSFSQDRQSLLTASRDGTIRIWNVADGTEKVVLRGHSGDVSSAQFSPNGAYVVTASSQDRTVRLWEAQLGREVSVLASPEQEGARPALTRAVFSSDGTRVAIVSSDASVRMVRVFPTLQDLIAYARHIVPRQLTACERRRFFLPVEGEIGDCPG